MKFYFILFILFICRPFALNAQGTIIAIQEFVGNGNNVVSFNRNSIVQDINGYYYLVVKSNKSGTLTIGGTEVIELADLPDWPEDVIIDPNHYVLVKLNGEDFSLIDYIKYKRAFPILSVDSEGEIFIKINTPYSGHYSINDSLYTVTDSISSTFYYVENDLDLVAFTGTQRPWNKSQLLPDGSILLRYSVIASISPFFNEFGLQYELPKVVNASGDSIYVNRQELCVRLDGETNEVLSSWGFGGFNGATVNGSTIDSDGNIVFTGYGSVFSFPFSFDGINFLNSDDVASNAFVVKYDMLGNVLYSFFTTWAINNEFNSVYSDVNDIYIAGKFRGESMSWGSEIIYNSEFGINNSNDKNGYVAKLKEDGSLDWIYDVPGYLDYSEVSDVAFINDKVYVVFLLKDGLVEFEGNQIVIDNYLYSSQIHVLDKTTGALLDYKVFDEAENPHILTSLYYDKNEHYFDLTWILRNECELFGISLGVSGKSSNYLMRVNDIDLLSSSVILYDDIKVQISPNPVFNILFIESFSNTGKYETYRIYNSIGRVMGTYQINLNFNHIDVSNFARGIYYLELLEGTKEAIKFIKI